MLAKPPFMCERLRMDAVTALLDGPRARGAFLLRTLMSPPWSVRVEDEAPLTLVAMARGRTWLGPAGGAAVPLDPGAVALVRGPRPYTVAGEPGTAPQATILPGQRCVGAGGRDLADMSLGVRTWGNDPAGSNEMLIGTYPAQGALTRRLLDALPPVLVVEVRTPLLSLLAEEVGRAEPGQQVVLDRLLDLLLIAVLRQHLAEGGTGWYHAYRDPVVGRALRLLQAEPAYPWTVAALAARSGASRAALARRFTDLVGEPPMAFLTGWRLGLAADLLREPGATLGAVARRVGYGSPYALSTAFKRVRGLSPAEHRSAAG